MRIEYRDIQLYQSCPLLYSKFKSIPLEKPLVKTALERSFFRVFLRDAELGHAPSFSAISNGIGKYISELKTIGYSTKMFNDLLIKLNDGFTVYMEKLSGFRAIAVNYESYIRSGSGIYVTTVPAVLSTANKELIPVFTPVGSESFDHCNYFRFASAILSENLNVPVREFFVVDVGNSEKDQIRITNHSTSSTPTILKELQNIISQMTSKVFTPNTTHCLSCEFRRKCNL